MRSRGRGNLPGRCGVQKSDRTLPAQQVPALAQAAIANSMSSANSRQRKKQTSTVEPQRKAEKEKAVPFSLRTGALHTRDACAGAKAGRDEGRGEQQQEVGERERARAREQRRRPRDRARAEEAAEIEREQMRQQRDRARADLAAAASGSMHIPQVTSSATSAAKLVEAAAVPGPLLCSAGTAAAAAAGLEDRSM